MIRSFVCSGRLLQQRLSLARCYYAAGKGQAKPVIESQVAGKQTVSQTGRLVSCGQIECSAKVAGFA